MVPTVPFLGFSGFVEQLIELRKTVYLLDDPFTRKYATQECRGQAVGAGGRVFRASLPTPRNSALQHLHALINTPA